MVSINYSCEELISDIHVLSAILEHTPTQKECDDSMWSPSATAFHNKFGNWNNALIMSGYEPNMVHTGDIDYTSGYKNGTLNPSSKCAKGLIGELIVSKVLGINKEDNCNIKHGFGYKYDLIHEVYGNIDVKTSKLNNVDGWTFKLSHGSDIDTYVFLMFDELHKYVEYVAIIPRTYFGYNKATSVFRGTIEKRWGDYLVDKSEYNRVISSMSIDKCPYMKNFKTGGRNFEN